MTLPQSSTQLPVKPPVVWKPGEHGAFIGRTGSGKTYLIKEIAQLWRYCVVLRTKPDKNTFRGFRTVRTASAMDAWSNEHIVLEPEYRRQAIEGYHMLEKVWQQGAWTCIVDENWYAERIGLKDYIERGLTQGRSKDITMIVGMQRPVQISRFALSEITHFFVFRCEGRDLKFSLRDALCDEIVPVVRNLKKYEFAYYNSVEGAKSIRVGNANALSKLIVSQYRSGGIDTAGTIAHDHATGAAKPAATIGAGRSRLWRRG